VLATWRGATLATIGCDDSFAPLNKPWCHSYQSDRGGSAPAFRDRFQGFQGGIMYLMVCTRPNIARAVSVLSTFIASVSCRWRVYSGVRRRTAWLDLRCPRYGPRACSLLLTLPLCYLGVMSAGPRVPLACKQKPNTQVQESDRAPGQARK